MPDVQFSPTGPVARTVLDRADHANVLDYADRLVGWIEGARA